MAVYTSDNKDRYTRVGSRTRDINGISVRYFRTLSPRAARETKLFLTPGMLGSARREIQYFDVVHLHEYRTFQNLIAWQAKRQGVPYVLHAHGSLSRVLAKKKLKWLYDVSFGYSLLRNASKVIAISKQEAKDFLSMGVPQEKIEVIPNGIDLSEYQNLPEKGAFKKKYSIDADEKIILYLGRIHQLKGIDFLIESFALAVKSGLKGVRLVLAGGDDGFLNFINNMISSLGISDQTSWVGPLTESEKISAYVDSMVLVHPERLNVFGLVPLEAAACATPVIVSAENNVSKIVEEGEFGLSVHYGDVQALAKMLQQVSNDNLLASKMGNRGREWVARNYELEKSVNHLERLYESIQESPSIHL